VAAGGAPSESGRIAFGTSGWRGLRDRDFSVPRVRVFARAVAAWLAEAGSGGEVVVAHDTRPGGEAFSAAASDELRARGHSVVRPPAAVPTPVAAHAVVSRGARAALVFTASHNPPEYAGVKVFGDWGGALDAEASRRIEAIAAAEVNVSDASPAAPEARFDLVTPYLDALEGAGVGSLAEPNRPRILYDAMHGAGSGVVDRAFARRGIAHRVLRGEALADFGGGAPEPVAERLGELSRAVRAEEEVVLGLATDGDADRLAVLDAAGRTLSETDALALLVDHLARTGRIERGVAVSVATGSLVERVAQAHGLRVERHPIGFKHLSRALFERTVDAAGEESGGFAWGRFGVDKDGILAAAFFVEMVAGDSPPLAKRLEELRERYGGGVCGRSAVIRNDPAERALARLAASPPSRLGADSVRDVDPRDGIRFAFDDGFLMLRASGTESLGSGSTPKRRTKPHWAGVSQQGAICWRNDPRGARSPRGRSRSTDGSGPVNLATLQRFLGGDMERRRVLLAVSGGIAAYKAPELVRELVRAGCDVRCVMTRNAAEFVTQTSLQTVSGARVATELFDRGAENEIDHIALADWADLMLVAPATANLIAKLALGLADDLVTTVALATQAPLLLAPAMNVNMWRHPATRENVARLRERGVETVGPDAGELACGWEGEGRMSDPAAIVAAARMTLGTRGLAEERVLVTAGGTREKIDAVRFLGNRSSGKMGFAIAAEAARRGAEVVLVAGPSNVATPPGVRRVNVESALEMRDAVFAELDRSTLVIKAAAVADFRPAEASARKIKKEDLPDGEGMRLELVRTPDILAEICTRPGERIVVGFAAESHDVIEAAQRKLARKGCDLIVANDITREASGFDSDTNAVAFVWPGGEVEELPSLPKSDVAGQLFDRLEKLRGGTE